MLTVVPHHPPDREGPNPIGQHAKNDVQVLVLPSNVGIQVIIVEKTELDENPHDENRSRDHNGKQVDVEGEEALIVPLEQRLLELVICQHQVGNV